MNVKEAIKIIDNCPGFLDETTSVGEAWETILQYIKGFNNISINYNNELFKLLKIYNSGENNE